MELWFTEEHTENVRFSFKVIDQLAGFTSDYQRIDIFDTEEFGKALVMDGFVMLTEKDEFIYHEMIVHVPMAVNPAATSVLIIGGGDGGTVRELAKYKGVKTIHLVEIDRAVVQLCQDYLPQTGSALSDQRLTIYYQDGMKFVRNKKDEYDLIIVDSTDPFGPGEGLFTREFYGNCFNALKENGILVNQHESPFYQNDAKAMQKVHKKLKKIFPQCRVYQAHIPTYPSGHWLFGFSSKGPSPVSGIRFSRWEKLEIATKYYNPELHIGAFALPTYVKELLGDE